MKVYKYQYHHTEIDLREVVTHGDLEQKHEQCFLISSEG